MSERVESLLAELVTEQRKTNELLSQLIQVQSQLIEALAEDGSDPDAPPARYMDGSPVR
jgi:regulator of RNase E activity RraB